MKAPKPGYVYLIKPKYKSGPFKIGMTTGDLAHRLSALQTSHYEDLEVLLVIDSPDPKALESELHKRFRPFKVRGEWFAASRAMYEAMIAMPGAYSPVGKLRDVGMLPNRPWHAAMTPSEIAAQAQGVQWPKWDEASTLAH